MHLAPRVQMAAAGAAAFLLGWFLIASAALLMKPVELIAHDLRMREKQHAIEEMANANAQLASRMKAMQQEFLQKTQELEIRQRYLDAIIEKQGGKVPAVAPTAPKAPAKDQVLQAEPKKDFVATRLDQVKSAQDRLIAAMVARTEHDIDRVSSLVDSVGLSSSRFLRIMAQTKPLAANQGGPMIPLHSETGKYDAALLAAVQQPGDSEDEFVDLLKKHRQLAGLQALLGTVPLASPVRDAYVTSPYGVRQDPIEGRAAFHPGLDLQSRDSQIITATAPGVVIFAGRDGEYGNAVIVNHRNGFQTRYAHMSRVAVRVGQTVAIGSPLGHMGSTGRSTGLHLHYEIWFNGKLQNPARFLKAADHVYDIRQAAASGQILGG